MKQLIRAQGCSSLPLGSALKALLNLLIKASRAALNKEPNDYAKLHEALRINFCSKWCWELNKTLRIPYDYAYKSAHFEVCRPPGLKASKWEVLRPKAIELHEGILKIKALPLAQVLGLLHQLKELLFCLQKNQSLLKHEAALSSSREVNTALKALLSFSGSW